MIDYADKALFLMDSVDKQLNIAYDGGEITNEQLASEDFCLVEKLTSNGTLVLGDCNSSYVEFSVGYGTDPIEGKELTVTITPKDAEDFQIGIYTVVSDKPTADRRWRKITAYDALYAVLNEDVTAWYDTILPEPAEGEEPTSITIKQFRDSFFSHVGLTQETVDLPNDAVEISRQASFSQLSGKVVLNAICEINGCFGRIDRTGTFRYTFLIPPSDPLYPSANLYPSHDIFPTYDNKKPTKYNGNSYFTAQYEDYYVQIKSIQIRTDKNDVGVTVGSGVPYIIEGNFLAYNLESDVLHEMAENILDKVSGVYYCPAETTAYGNPCLEIGDPIILETRYAKVETIIIQRKLKGIQSLLDSYVSKGTRETKKNINSTASKLAQTDGKINKVEKIVAEEIEADRARIGYIEANYVQTSTLVANYATITSLEAVDGKIDNLTAIAITTQNLSAQSINAAQITAGTISTDRLDTAAIAAATVTATTITGALQSPTQGTITIGSIRSASFQYYNGSSYDALSLQTITINGTTYRLLGC